MSRSKKKNPIYKDKGFTDYNKVFRRKSKQLIKKTQLSLEELETLLFYKKNELINQWDICDYTFRDIDTWYTGKNKYKAYLK
jgi:hypothetical protein